MPKGLFAEANKDFIDFLFNIMALPIGIFVRLLNKEGIVGSLSKLYKSIEESSHVHMQQPFQTNEALLNPEVLAHSGVANLPPLLPDIESSNNSIDKGFYRCQ